VKTFRFGLFAAKYEGVHFIQMKRSRTAPTEDHGLSARFINHSIALKPARNAIRFAFALECRD